MFIEESFEDTEKHKETVHSLFHDTEVTVKYFGMFSQSLAPRFMCVYVSTMVVFCICVCTVSPHLTSAVGPW